jgi:hypothetical protein
LPTMKRGGLDCGLHWFIIIFAGEG